MILSRYKTLLNWFADTEVIEVKKRVELPLMEPLYNTYNYHGIGSALAVNNPTIRNWYLNEIMNLTCGRKFLSGYTTPEITVVNSSWVDNPYFEKKWASSEFAKGYINPIIREMINKGFYVCFNKVDDYYIKGKAWYKERHFSHDGVICGYDQEEKTYCIYAYDSKWVSRKFWTPQKSFNAGMNAMRKQGVYSSIWGLKVKDDIIEFSPRIVYSKIKEYLDSNIEKYPFDGEGKVYGIVVHEYIAEYILKLHREEIPYERMDRRVFRLIWEHKKVMLERITLVEQMLGLDDMISERYKHIVSEADTMRMLYASHHMKRRDSVLPVIKEKLLALMKNEREILELLVEKMEKELENESVELSEK